MIRCFSAFLLLMVLPHSVALAQVKKSGSANNDFSTDILTDLLNQYVYEELISIELSDSSLGDLSDCAIAYSYSGRLSEKMFELEAGSDAAKASIMAYKISRWFSSAQVVSVSLSEGFSGETNSVFMDRLQNYKSPTDWDEVLNGKIGECEYILEVAKKDVLASINEEIERRQTK